MASSTAHQRLVPLEEGFNLRDFGGYETADGGRVKYGQLFRSGTMCRLTASDQVTLRALGIRSICDFRRANERRAEPTRWHEPDGIAYWCSDLQISSGVLEEVLSKPGSTPDSMRAVMIQMYRDLPVQHASSYREMFRRTAEGGLPLLINCSAGKDRTGVAAALLLSVLNVPRDTIERDYLETNIYADWDKLFSIRDSALARSIKLRPDVTAPILKADFAYLDALFASLDAEHGGLNAYLATIGVDTDVIARIRTQLIEP